MSRSSDIIYNTILPELLQKSPGLGGLHRAKLTANEVWLVNKDIAEGSTNGPLLRNTDGLVRLDTKRYEL